MLSERRRQFLLGAVALILVLVVYREWPTTSTGPAPSSNGGRATTRAAQNAPASTTAPEVHLEALESERTQPEAGGRNLFRFKPKAPPPPPPVVAPPVAPVAPAPTGPPPPPLAAIALKFIGLVEATERSQKIAILSDGRNLPFYGREGDIIEGRYRILKIGVESVELAYVDGRGRQTIRLSGG